ncbi:MAG: hypothetical protein R3B82_13150 [Sandaracinaceae bacterium]
MASITTSEIRGVTEQLDQPLMSRACLFDLRRFEKNLVRVDRGDDVDLGGDVDPENRMMPRDLPPPGASCPTTMLTLVDART